MIQTNRWVFGTILGVLAQGKLTQIRPLSEQDWS